MKKLSLTSRLILVVLVTFIVSALIATTISLFQAKKSLKEYFDTQLFYYAKTISFLDKDGFQKADIDELIPDKKSKNLKNNMNLEDDALTFAVFDTNGNMIFNDGGDSEDFVFNPTLFYEINNVYIDLTTKYKIVWALSEDKTFVVAVGQEIEFVDDIMFDILEEQIIPWLVILPILIILIIILIVRELLPLKKLTQTLQTRGANDSSHIDDKDYPKELKPFIQALNSLFSKISNMIENERRFTSNAAHELKTPLAALKIQTEVAQLSFDDPESLNSALENINIGIDRATRLIEQMLTISRLDNLEEFDSVENIRWIDIINSTIKEYNLDKNCKNIKIDIFEDKEAKNVNGDPLMLSLLIKNILENTIKYNKDGTHIKIDINSDTLNIEDNGKGVSEEFLKRAGDRFYRPSGQKENGSGLGLSIVRQIAFLHHFDIAFNNISGGGFKTSIKY